MQKKWKVVLGVVGALALVGFILPQAALAYGGPGGSKGRGNMTSSEMGRVGAQAYGSGGYYYTADSTLSTEEEDALLMALDDEYKALATYLGVMDQFGEVYPFVSIAQSEESHIAALVRLFDKYGIDVPENEWIGNTPEFDSVEQACAAGVVAETENAALYDELFSMVDNPDIVQVFTRLSTASETRHLPAFAACAEGDGTYVPVGTGPSGEVGGFGGVGGYRGGR